MLLFITMSRKSHTFRLDLSFIWKVIMCFFVLVARCKNDIRFALKLVKGIRSSCYACSSDEPINVYEHGHNVRRSNKLCAVSLLQTLCPE